MAVEHLVSMLPPELRDEYREIMTMGGQADQALKPLVKAADKISAVIKCVEERRSGNRDSPRRSRPSPRPSRRWACPRRTTLWRSSCPATA